MTFRTESTPSLRLAKFLVAKRPKSMTGTLRAVILSLGLLFVIAGCATTPKVDSTLPVNAPMSVYGLGVPGPIVKQVTHIVGPQETLWRISKTYGVDIDTILRANHLAASSPLKNGQKLLIPNARGPIPVIPLYPSHRWTYIVVHHTATDEGTAYSIDQLHHKRGFWNGLGYHFLIDNGTDGMEDGQIQVGPRWVKQMDGAHANADGMNQKGIGIALVGNFSERNVSVKELDSLVFLVKTLQKYYHIPSSRVIGHRNVKGKKTECPGTRFPWSDFKARIR